MSGPAGDVMERLADAVAHEFGLEIAPQRGDTFERAVCERANARQLDGPAAYADWLDGAPQAIRGQDLQRLAQSLTVSETSFFRNEHHFEALRSTVLPARIAANAASRELSILSAGCASGEEPASLAMLLREGFPQVADWNVRILGLDVSEEMIARAREGEYRRWSLRSTPEPVTERWFRKDNDAYHLDATVRDAIEYRVANLLDPDAAWLRPGQWDLVMCRNVIIYFSSSATRQLVARLAGALKPGGFLFMGHSETLRGISDAYHLCHTDSTFYYQRPDGSEGPASRPPPSGRPLTLERALPAAPEPPDSKWVAGIDTAASAIAALRGRHAATAGARATARPAAPAGSRTDVLELMRGERWQDALALLARDGATPDAEGALLRAALLTQAGRLDEADTACHAVLGHDEFSAGAHYLLSVIAEAKGNRRAAQDHAETAAYLDPRLAMPHMQLGVLALAAGDRPRAVRYLHRAAELFATEQPGNLLLFGGGFSRDALVRLCQSQARSAEAVR